MKLKITLLLFFLIANIHAQNHEKYKEDIDYELKHKSESWFSDMKDGANYFEVKNKFDSFFGNKQWEKSKPRALGESWLKSKLYYLDINGFVQANPSLKESYDYNTPLNSFNSTSQIGSWELLGPVNSASTEYSGKGNHGGYVYLNRIDPTNNLKRFVSFVTGGLWMTNDGGENWTLVDSNLPDDKYLDLDVSISNPSIIYAISDSQVIKSTDGGLNWKSTALTNSTYSGKAYDIAVSTSNSNIVLARWGDKIYRTTNGGSTWFSVITNLPNHETWDSSVHSEMLDWSTTNSNVVYSLSTSHNNSVIVHRSANYGATFSKIATLKLSSWANGQTVGWAKLFLPSTNTTSIYIAVGSGDSPYNHKAAHLYKINATTGTLENTKTNMITGIGDPYDHDPVLHHGDICMDRNNENKIVYSSYANDKIFFSTNNGTSFTLSKATIHPDIRTIDVVNNVLLIGNDGESVTSTDNGTTMTTLTNSISNHELWGFGSAFKTNLVASGNNHGPVMIKEPGNGFDWYNGTGADQGNTDVNPLDDRYIYSNGYDNYRYFRTGVHTLINEANSLDTGGIYSYFNSMEFHPNNYYTIITHHAGQYPVENPNLYTWKRSLIKTEDNGNTISIVKTFNDQVFREKISMKNPNHIYVVEGLTNNKLWHTTDAGITWVNITPSLSESSGQTNISDLAVSDENPNEIWLTYSGVQSSCKVLKSNNYGENWTNLTQTILSEFPMTKIIFQRGSNGGVYVGNKSGIYYKNNIMSNWKELGNGLPMAEIRFMFINYNENRLKIGTSRGAFANDLYEISPPNALISSDINKILCTSTDKIQFKDYSVVRNSSAKWSWSFPGGTPSTSNEENPKVSYTNASDGFYDVTLTITDDYGTSTQTLDDFVEISNQCQTSVPDPFPGNVANLKGSANNDYLSINNLNLDNRSFTFSCWIKPKGIQEDYSAIFSTQNTDNSLILNFMNGDNTIGFHPEWYWSSGLQVPPNEWSHVALVSDGKQVKIYVNGVESINNTAMSSVISSKIDLGRFGKDYYNSRYTNLEMDEVSFWDRPLTIDEIRQWRHLTKTDITAPIFTGLVAYYQFNESKGSISKNKASTKNDATYYGTSSQNHTVSTAPIFDGVSEKLFVNSSGIKNFNTAGLSMNFDYGTYPNGDLWVFRSTINPDILPDTGKNFDSYTIVNNYGLNQYFTPLKGVSFYNNPNFILSSAENYNLYKRNSNDFGNSWGTKLDTADAITQTNDNNTLISFTKGLYINSFSQFVLSNSSNHYLFSTDSSIKTKINPLVYPNPLMKNDDLIIEIPSTWENTTMIIYNLSGQKVNQVSLHKGKNILKLNNTPPGVYTTLIFNSKHKFFKRIVLN